jgi:uncharacterized protein YtpQ (UPF0354 family)
MNNDADSHASSRNDDSRAIPSELRQRSTDADPYLVTYHHPHNYFQMDYPAHWDVQYASDDHSVEFVHPTAEPAVGLIIFRSPMSVDARSILDSGRWPNLAEAMFQKIDSSNIRKDPTLIYPNYTADRPEPNEAGQRWFLIESDLLLCISSTLPVSQRETFYPVLERMLSSLRIDRNLHWIASKILDRFAATVRKRMPDTPMVIDGHCIRLGNIEVSIENLLAQIAQNPEHMEEATEEFIEATMTVAIQRSTIGQETWDSVQDRILPLIKPDMYIQHANAQTQKRTEPIATDEPPPFLVSAPWLANLRLCFAIDDAKSFRFVNSNDLHRWKISLEQLCETAARNLAKLPAPEVITIESETITPMIGNVQSQSGPISSFILHPQLFDAASKALGRDLLAAIPARDALLVFGGSEHRERILHALRLDFQSSVHPISDRLFRITPDGIALA